MRHLYQNNNFVTKFKLFYVKCLIIHLKLLKMNKNVLLNTFGYSINSKPHHISVKMT